MGTEKHENESAKDNQEKESSNTGCLLLFLLAIPLLDAFGLFISSAGPYNPVVFLIGLIGFASGAALGAYVSVKIRRRPWYSSCSWAIYGLFGMILTSALTCHIFSAMASHQSLPP